MPNERHHFGQIEKIPVKIVRILKNPDHKRKENEKGRSSNEADHQNNERRNIRIYQSHG